jgi:hypothetical protein
MRKKLSALLTVIVALSCAAVLFAKDDEKPIVIANPAAVSPPASDIEKANAAEKKRETDRNAAIAKAKSDANAAKVKAKSDAETSVSKARSDSEKAVSKAASDVKGAK